MDKLKQFQRKQAHYFQQKLRNLNKLDVFNDLNIIENALVDDDTISAEPTTPTRRRFKDGDNKHRPWTEEIFTADTSHKCPTYVHRTPPCQGSCPSGEDVRGWLSIVRGVDKPGDPEMPWQEYAFRRLTEANPFPSIMGRVCPAPCEDGCNRNAVEEFVGINSIEHFVGDYALEQSLSFEASGPDSGKKVAIIGGGPAGLATAYHLRRCGHGATIFDDHDDLGGLMRYGIPGYRTPRDILDQEIQRITDMGVELRLGTRIGRDVTLAELEDQYDAIVVAIGARQGSTLPIPGAEGTANCLTGVDFLEAFNMGRLQHTAEKVVVIGGGDTAMDVAAVARRLGHIEEVSEKDRPEMVVLGFTTHDVATVATRQGAKVTVLSREPLDEMPASRAELEHVSGEGVSILGGVLPVEVIKGEDGRATALKVAEVTWNGGQTTIVEDSEFEIECDLIVGAIGQRGDLKGLETLDDGSGKIKADKFFQVPDKPGYFLVGDAVRPHLLTTAIGHASVAADSIDQYFDGHVPGKRPKVDVHHFDLLSKLRETNQEPEAWTQERARGTSESKFAVHNYDDRSTREIIASDQLFLGHWQDEARNRRQDEAIGPDAVLGHFEERIVALSTEQVRAEANRCMSCGMCFECDSCVVFCPQNAVKRQQKDARGFGRYVDTDYSKCIGCHICADVCPSGYIEMGMGE